MSSVYHHDDADPSPYPEKKIIEEALWIQMLSFVIPEEII